MLAEVAARLRRYDDAETLLARCLELSPSFDAARHNYAVVLNRKGKGSRALPQVEALLAKEPRNPGYLNLKAAILANLGDYCESIEVYEAVLKEFPRQPKIWMSYGHSLKTARRYDDSVAAYRRAIGMEPTLGEAYWSLANLKTFRFSTADVVALRAALERSDLADEDRLHFEFALGKALEDAETYEQAFAHYARGNAMRKALHPYSADENQRFVGRCKEQFTAEFFAARKSAGACLGRAHFHRRAAARRLDAARADSRQPLAGRRHHGAAGYSAAGAGTGGARRPRSRSTVFRRGRRLSAPTSCDRSASAIWNPPACTARPRRRFSSTRCRTTGCTSG